LRLRLTLAFLLMGFSFTILQTVFVRELLVSFSGNELSIGLVLGAWLLLEALGSGVAGRILRFARLQPAAYAALQLLLALLLLPAFWAALQVRAVLGTVPGEAIGPLPALAGALFSLAPLGLVDGAMFAVACAVLQTASDQARERESSRVYILEATGSILGGVAFTFLLLPVLSSTQFLFLIAALNTGCAAALLAGPPRTPAAAGVSALLAVAALLTAGTPLGMALHQRLVSARWAPSPLAYEANSPYGNVAVLREANQVTVLSNGTPVLTAPDPDIAAVEEETHLPLLFLDRPPKRILVIGGGAGGVLGELLRYPVERIDYAELDPLLIRVLRIVPTPLTEAELSDPRVALAIADGRRFVASMVRSPDRPTYDFILVNLPYPSTLVVNRLYTEEFYQQVERLLAPEGVLAVPAPAGRTYRAPALRELLACYQRTLLQVFPYVRAVPGDEITLWLAARRPFTLSAEDLVHRWEVRGLETRMLRPEHLRYLFDPEVAAAFEESLGDTQVVANRDVYPAGLRYGLAYESAILSPQLEPFFHWLGRLRGWHLGLGLVGLLLIGLFALRRPETLVPPAIATTGVVGMATDLLVLFAFQLRYGYVYQQVGLLVTAFMAGLALGGLSMRTWIGKGRLRTPWTALVALEAATVLSMGLLAGLLAFLLRRSAPAHPLEPLLLYGINLLGGVLVGMEFPLGTQLLIAQGDPGVRAASSLYAWDLAGATLGAVSVSAILLPALGLLQTALLVALLKGVSLAWLGSRYRALSSR